MLEDEPRGAEVQGSTGVGHVLVHGQEHDLHRRVVPLQDRQGIQAVQVRHGDVGHDDIGPQRLRGRHQGAAVLHVGGEVGRWQRACGSIEDAGTFGNPYAMPYENNRPIFICRDPKIPLDELWPRLKRFR